MVQTELEYLDSSGSSIQNKAKKMDFQNDQKTL